MGAETGTYGITRYAKSGLIIAFLIGYIALVSMSVVSAENAQIKSVESKDTVNNNRGIDTPGKDTSIMEDSTTEENNFTLLEFVLENQEIFSSIAIICLALIFKVGLRVTESKAEQKWRAPDIDWLNYE